MQKSDEKTNVMRILDQKKIPYKSYCYVNTGAISGVEVARVLNQDEKRVFKTLVTTTKNNKIYVFMIPVAEELNLKKSASVVTEKSIEMLKSKDLLQITGYVHGGCSPIGMKKNYEIIIDSSAFNYETIIFSAGKIGYQVELSIENLKKIIPFKISSITI